MSAVNNMTLPKPKLKVGESRTRALWVYTALALVALAVAFGMELFYAGTDVQQGEVQRLFYIHMGSFFGAFVAFGVAVFAGAAYLRTRNVRWDILALSSIEVGIILAFINLATGSVWARPIWNTWWTWDPRLTSAAVMELTYVAYLMLRRGIENPETRRRFASIYGILAFSTVLFTLLVTRIRPDTIHSGDRQRAFYQHRGRFCCHTGDWHYFGRFHCRLDGISDPCAHLVAHSA